MYRTLSEIVPLPYNVQDIHTTDVIGRTALHYAAGWGRNEMVIALLDRGADISVVSTEGWTPLHHAAAFGHKETVIKLLDRGAEINVRTSKFGETPLLLSLFGDYKDVTLALLERGCDYKMKDVEDCAPLHVAAEQGWSDVVQELLKKGVNIHERDNTGMTPLHCAAFNGHRDVVEILVQAESLEAKSGGDGANKTIDTRSPAFSFHNLNSNIELLSKLAVYYPDDYICTRLMGEAFFERKQYSDASTCFERALQLDPKNVSVSHVDEIDQSYYECDSCSKNIIGIRHTCKECDDFDWCNSCYSSPATRSEHEETHEFFRVPSEDWKPVTLAQRQEDNAEIVEKIQVGSESSDK